LTYWGGGIAFGSLLGVGLLFPLPFNAVIMGLIGSLLLIVSAQIYQVWALRHWQREKQRLVALWMQDQEHYQKALNLWQATHDAMLRTIQGQFQSREKHLKELLQGQVRQPNGTGEAQRGVSEKLFGRYLVKYFPELVFGSVSFEIPGSDYRYSTDFCLGIEEVELWIDVEIDEPYEGRKKQPHHCLDTGKDEKRTQFFLEGNWVVIRFAEEQVVNNPLACCREIAQVLGTLTGNYQYLTPLLSVKPLEKVKRWTQAEALLMVKRKFRERYLAKTGTYVPLTRQTRRQLTKR
jgi:hypothetical protein